MLQYDERIGNKNLSEFGLEKFIISGAKELDNKDLSQIVAEEIYIDEFIKKYSDSFEITGEGVIEKDIEKANIINRLINQPSFEKKEQAEGCMHILIGHLCNNLENYKDELGKSGINWEQKQEQLDGMLEPLGIDCEFIELNKNTIMGRENQIMKRIEKNRDIKYIVQLERLSKMIISRERLKLAGVEDNIHEQNYTEIIQELSDKIDIDYWKELSNKGKLKEFSEKYVGHYKVFSNLEYLYDLKTSKILTKEERFERAKNLIDDIIDKDVESSKGIEMIEEYYREAEKTESLYTKNEAGKSTVYANPKIKEDFNNKLQEGLGQKEEQKETGMEQEEK